MPHFQASWSKDQDCETGTEGIQRCDKKVSQGCSKEDEKVQVWTPQGQFNVPQASAHW